MNELHWIGAITNHPLLAGDNLEDLLLTNSIITENFKQDKMWRSDVKFALYFIANILKSYLCKDKSLIKPPSEMNLKQDISAQEAADALNELAARFK